MSRPGGWRLGCRQCSSGHGVRAQGMLVASPASVMVVGDPPCAGPDRAGRGADERGRLLLLRALADAGIEQESVCFTHLVDSADVREEPGRLGGHRLKPADRAREPGCAPWTNADLTRFHPRVVVLLGTSAARSLLGAGYAPRRQRGTRLEAPPGLGLEPHPAVVVTANPVSVCRSRHRAFDYDALVRDLLTAADCLTNA